MSDVASAAGISEAAVYKHFPSKKSLFLEVLDYMTGQNLLRMEEEARKEQDVLRALRNMVAAFSESSISRLEEVKVRAQAISEIDDTDVAARLHENHMNFVLFLRRMVDRGMEQGSIRSDLDVESIVLLMDAVAMFMESMKLLALEEKMAEAAAVKMMDHLTKLMEVEP